MSPENSTMKRRRKVDLVQVSDDPATAMAKLLKQTSPASPVTESSYQSKRGRTRRVLKKRKS